ncbi:MAG: hypothetical protein M3N35_04640 [Candidatus Binatota bacterium]|nr:hypothetical protein [Candidatus Binatota bacterium]
MGRLQVIGYYPLPPFVVAQEKGLFAQEGLKIDFTIATLAPEHNKGMVEGRWDISLTSPDTMIARVTRDGHDFLLYLMAERGLEVKLIGAKRITALPSAAKRNGEVPIIFTAYSDSATPWARKILRRCKS